MATHDDEQTEIPGTTSRRSLCLLVLAGNDVATHPLSAGHAVVIGRGADCDVRIDHPSVSRRHARLQIGRDARMTLEDLESANGTIVRPAAPRGGALAAEGARLVPGVGVALAPGDFVDLGQALVLPWWSAAQDLGPRHEGSAAHAVTLGAMAQLRELVARVAPSELNVLLLGETGVGKEVFAERIHAASPRATRPLVRLHCAALSPMLLESELFGHEKGSFTGAVTSKPGLLESAHGGTVFLDEIGELPSEVQVKLLRVLEERAVLRVGALRPRPIDVRFVAATHRDLEAAVAAGDFRADLFFRLDGISLVIPPLRERLDELEPLAREFATQAAARLGRRAAPALSPDALALLARHPFPGNVRELRQVIERAVVLADGDTLTPAHLRLSRVAVPRPVPASTAPPPSAPSPTPREAVSTADAPGSVAPPDDDTRRRTIEALARCGGNQTRAAEVLGISRRTLVTRLREYGLPRPRKRHDGE